MFRVYNELSSSGQQNRRPRLALGENMAKQYAAIGLLLLTLKPVFAAIVTVTSSADTEGACSTLGTGSCTLRDAINFANAAVGNDTIEFNIPGAADQVRTIRLQAGLPSVTEALVIDGFTQPGARPNSNPVGQGLNARLLIEIDGQDDDVAGSGCLSVFYSEPEGVVIQGLAIHCRLNAITIQGGTRDNVIQGNYIGTDPTGTTALGGTSGIVIFTGSGSRIGGLLPAQRNLISGHALSGIAAGTFLKTDLTIQGNLIGTDASGGRALGNRVGVNLSTVTRSVVGGNSAAARNVISGNNVGVSMGGDTGNNLVQNNIIGADVSGTLALGKDVGVRVSAPGTTISDNVIVANEREGIDILGGADQRVAGNRIGVSAGDQPLGNGDAGVSVTSAANAVIENNIIAHNGGFALGTFHSGVFVQTGARATIRSNAIFANVGPSSGVPRGLGIDLNPSGGGGSDGVTANDDLDGDSGGNGLQNYPELAQATLTGAEAVVRGRLSSAANGTYRVEFFANRGCDASGYGEGRFFLGEAQVSTDAAGEGRFAGLRFALPEPGARVLTATATDAAGNTSEFSFCGQARSLPSVSAQPQTRLPGERADGELGFSAAGAGDINGDGFVDLVAGAPGYGEGQVDEGAVQVYLGSAAGVSETVSQRLTLNRAAARLGTSVAGVGDVNGDGFDDVAAGAPGYGEGQVDEGAVLLYLGSATGLSASPVRLIEGGQAGAQLGFSVVGIGDINNDGFDDLAAGLPGYREGGAALGAVGVILGAPTAALPSALDQLLLGEQAGSEFGAAVAGVDVNGDGRGDVLVGAPGYDDDVALRGVARRGVNVDAGAVYVFTGTGAGVNATAVAVARGANAGDRLGSSLVGFDVTGDGFGDTLVGAPGYSNGQLNEGAVLVYAGQANADLRLVQTLESNHIEALLGTSLAGVGDLNSDGVRELLAGAPGYSNGQRREGAGFLYLSSGDPGAPYEPSPQIILEGNALEAQLGKSVSSVGLDETGSVSPLQLVLGAPGADTAAGINAGEVRLYALLAALFASSFENTR